METIALMILCGTAGICIGYVFKHIQDTKYLKSKQHRINVLEGKVTFLKRHNDRLIQENARLSKLVNDKQIEAASLYDKIYNVVSSEGKVS